MYDAWPRGIGPGAEEMSFLSVIIEDAERQLKALQTNGTCDASHLQPMIEWLEQREASEDQIKASRLYDAFKAFDPKIVERSSVYAARTLRETLAALAAGKEKSDELFSFALGILSAWDDIQSVHS